MINVEEALERVSEFASALPPCLCDLSAACGRVLAEKIVSDVDSPPFDKSMVDGFAISLGDASERLHIAEIVTAGCIASRPVERGTTIHVMTGAPTPPGTDAVVKWEDCDRLDEQTIRNPRAGVAAGYCVLAKGTSYRAGDALLESGKRLGPLDIGLLAEVGRPAIQAIPRPTVGVLATGDELIASGDRLDAGRIRNSNGPMLLATVASAQCEAVDLGVARDDAADLENRIARGLQYDVLLVCGGVSAGIKDYVPGVLAQLGVSQVFHKVQMKPGKPLWFGCKESNGRRTLVFGLPGNPVSAYVAFRLFAAPALVALSGGRFATPSRMRRRLISPLSHRGSRPTYHPCRFSDGASAQHEFFLGVEPLAWRGSADLATLTQADCLAVLPPGDYELAGGAEVDVHPLPRHGLTC